MTVFRATPLTGDDYDPVDDLWKSVAYAFQMIRERMAAGGPGWIPHMRYPLLRECEEGEAP